MRMTSPGGSNMLTLNALVEFLGEEGSWREAGGVCGIKNSARPTARRQTGSNLWDNLPNGG